MSETFSFKHLVAGLAMFAALGASVAMQPPKAKANAQIGLNTMVPEAFGEWRIDPSSRMAVTSPDVAKSLANVYAEILTRTYINEAGERVMLSIAYTGDIDLQMDIHRPEMCYPAQGFSIVEKPTQAVLSGVGNGLGVRRLVARQGGRIEPITYWITSGDVAVASGWERKLVKLRYGLTGQVPDGMLLRVSTISPDSNDAFRLQERFVGALVGAVPEKDKKRFIGVSL